ncbi:MAG: flagellar motor protein MotB [Pseudomonadota bacterium]
MSVRIPLSQFNSELSSSEDRWILSYADFITILFAFFVVMYAISSVNEDQYRVLSESLEKRFSNQVLPTIDTSSDILDYADLPSINPALPFSPIAGEGYPKLFKDLISHPIKNPTITKFEKQIDQLDKTSLHVIKNEMQDIKKIIIPESITQNTVDQLQANNKSNFVEKSVESKENSAGQTNSLLNKKAVEFISQETNPLMQDLKKNLDKWINEGHVQVAEKNKRLEISIQDGVLFAVGEAIPDFSATDIIQEIASRIYETQHFIFIEGFTDNSPIATSRFPSNWELSAGRAAAMVRLFTEYGVAPNRLAAVGYGEHRPIADNDTVEGKALNRRVVIILAERI